jgi:hypothetical protein
MMHNLIISGSRFVDASGRTAMLRGINLGGSSKVPMIPNGATINREGFFDQKKVSFVGRPFPLEEADEHFERLKLLGFNFLRFLVTWEAIEHEGPGIYDEEYLEYLTQVVKKAGEYDFNLFIDPHEDVWSRFTGGDGAPGWTLELAGFDLHNLNASGAAVVHCIRGDPYPRMLWPTNNFKLAAATMWTLFFGGRTFAPSLTVDGISIQDYLQEHYINAIREIALRLKKMPHVIGYDTLNEPSHGWIGVRDMTREAGILTLFENPTVLQSMVLGEGIPQVVKYWELGLIGPQRKGTRLLNEAGFRAWRKNRRCIWRSEGVWDVDKSGKPVVLKPDHFAMVNAKPIDFTRNFMRPFVDKFCLAIRDADPQAVIFLEDEPDINPRVRSLEELKPLVNAAHWYDVMTLLSNRYSDWFSVDKDTRRVVIGRKAIDRMCARQLNSLKDSSKEMGDLPTLLGEFGIPFDMHEKQAYQSNDFKNQLKAMDRCYRAVEANLLDSTLWNYTSDNSNLRGDQWNDEDFSIYSPDQRNHPENLYSGGRALSVVVRPYPRYTSGIPLMLRFDPKTADFEYRYASTTRTGDTELFIPTPHYPRGIEVKLSDGNYDYLPEEQRLIHHPLSAFQEHNIQIKRK